MKYSVHVFYGDVVV